MCGVGRVRAMQEDKRRKEGKERRETGGFIKSSRSGG